MLLLSVSPWIVAAVRFKRSTGDLALCRGSAWSGFCSEELEKQILETIRSFTKTRKDF